MKVYIVPDAEISAAGFVPNHSIRFPAGSYEAVQTPAEADVIITGVDLLACKDRDLFLRVPCMARYEARCVIGDCADNYVHYNSPAILIRGNLNQARLADSPNSLNLGWPVENMALPVKDINRAVPLVPPGGFTHDVGFHGWVRPDQTRERAVASCLREFGTSFDVATYPDFAGYLFESNGTPKPEWLRRRALFVDSMTRCRVQLCPESIDGVLPYRFLESIAAGRVAVLVGSNYVLPWRDEICYEDFCLFVPEHDAVSVGHRIREFISTETDESLIARGAKARAAFVRYLDSTYSPARQFEAVEKKARQLGLVR